jgi:hypothetical protein
VQKSKTSNHVNVVGKSFTGDLFDGDSVNRLLEEGTPPPINYNFDLSINKSVFESSYSISNQSDFVAFLTAQGGSSIVVSNFIYTSNRIACELSINMTDLFFLGEGILAINSLECVETQLTTFLSLGNALTTTQNLENITSLQFLYLDQNQISTITNISALINLTTLGLSNNLITTAQFDNLAPWATIAPNNGTILVSNNTNNFNTSITRGILLAKGWTIL